MILGSPTKKGENQIKIVTTPSSQTLFNKFVSDTARQIGIKITNEEVIPGVTCDSVSRVMSQSVCSFMDELIRRSFAHGWMRNGEKYAIVLLFGFCRFFLYAVAETTMGTNLV